MNKDENILAGIVIYKPDLARLEENISAIKPQVKKVVLIDNNDEVSNDLFDLVSKYDLDYISNNGNKGIAYALNRMLVYGNELNYKWVLTLDQDSVVADNLIETYLEAVDTKNVALISPTIVDRNANLTSVHSDENYTNVKFAITSGCLTNIQVWGEIGGFDESLFIDSVDLDYCINVIKNGYTIIKSNKTHILHEVGQSEIVRLFGKDHLAFHHSKFRCYYMIRNLIYLGRKYNHISFFVYLMKAFKRMIIVLMYEKDKYNKSNSMIKGFCDGLIMNVNK